MPPQVGTTLRSNTTKDPKSTGPPQQEGRPASGRHLPCNARMLLSTHATITPGPQRHAQGEADGEEGKSQSIRRGGFLLTLVDTLGGAEPISGELGLTPIEFGRCRATSAQIWSNIDQKQPLRLGIGQTGPISTDVRPSSVKFGPESTLTTIVPDLTICCTKWLLIRPNWPSIGQL